MARLSQSLEHWPTIEEAAERLKTSVRTIWRQAEARKIELRKRPRPGKKPENVCNPDDVDRLMPTAHVMPEQPAVAVARRPASNGAVHPWQTALETIATILSRQRDDGTIGRIPATSKLWLNLEEAQHYSGLARNDLLTLCREGKIAARKSGGWRIRRASLEEFAG